MKILKAACLLMANFFLFASFCEAQNLAVNPGFESGTSPWTGFGATLTAPTTMPHSGSHSGYVTGRNSGTWNGVGQSFLGVMQSGVTYAISAWVRLDGSNSQPVMLTLQQTDGSGTFYHNVASGTITSNGWTHLNGNFTLTASGSVTTLFLYCEGPATNVNFYADDLDVEAVVPVGEIDANIGHQTIAGFGGAIAFYNNWITAHPYKLEMYTNMFQGLNLGILRIGDWFRYQGTANFDPDTAEIVSNANRILGRPVAIEMSSWSPPGFLKSNGTVGNGGTLVTNNGGFAYTNFANYWYDSLMWYKTNGIVPTWISIQNEPDWAASYDSCVFHPTEDTVNGINYASYAKALDATYQRLTNLPAPPKLLAPEVLGIGFNNVQNYAAYMNSNSFYGVDHHLYHGGAADSADLFIPSLTGLANVFPNKPKFQTEYGETDMLQTALLINHSMTFENASAYIFWSLDWPVGGPALVQQEYPWDQSTWTNAPPGTPTQSHGYWLTPQYYALKQFSWFITNGFTRVETPGNDPNLRLSACLSPDGRRLVEVMINPYSTAYAVTNTIHSFTVASSMVYQTVGTNAQVSKFASLGSAPANLRWSLPGYSITTVVFDSPASVVTTTNDSGPGSLRQLVSDTAPGATITFTNTLSGQTIRLTSGAIMLNKNVTIDGSMLANPIQINGNHARRVFLVTNATVLLDSLIITNGFADTDGNTHQDIPDNRGGGIYTYGNLTVNRCTFAGNHSSHGGGAINTIAGTLVVSNSTFYGNDAGYGGGAIINYGPATVSQCTMVNNSATYGGGMLLYAAAAVNQCTVVSNSATAYPGGLYGFAATLSLTNSIVSGNTSPPVNGGQNLQGTVVQGGANYTNSNPSLTPLGNYGGPTPTMPPLPGSPVINGCINGTSFSTDQRGIPRIFGTYADIGSVEAQPELSIDEVDTTSTNATVILTLNTYGAVMGFFINWGTTTNYESGSQFLGADTASGQTGYLFVNGLAPGTLYHFALSATNASGIYFGNDVTNTTLVPPVVTTTNDSGPGSLRQVIANAAPDAIVTFAGTLSGQTIRLTTGEILLNKNLTIDGSALIPGVILSGNDTSRIFTITNSPVVWLDSLTLQNGAAGSAGGGAIRNYSPTVTLNRCTLNNNSSAGGNGGAIETAGYMALQQCTVVSNSAARGGAVYVNQGGIVMLNQCAIVNNSATASVGGIYNNEVADYTNSIIALNGGTDLYLGDFGVGRGNRSGVNIIQGVSGSSFYPYTGNGVVMNTNPLLGPLADNGGPTRTMLPLPGSPAINGCTNGESFASDQRGTSYPRIYGTYADIGAAELQIITAATPPALTGLTQLGNGTFQFGFASLTGASFTVFASTNLALPFNQWSNLGPAVESPAGSGQYHFADPQATNCPQRYYRVSSP